jgi:hypothetical protein
MWRSGGTAPVIIKLGTTWQLGVQLHAPIALFTGSPRIRGWVGPKAGLSDLDQKKNKQTKKNNPTYSENGTTNPRSISL